MIPMLSEPRRRALILIAASGVVVLSTVLLLQYGYGAAPCPLCIWQRWPWLALVVLGIGGVFVRPGIALALCALAALIGAGIGGYHFAIEQGIVPLPQGCVAGAGAGSVEELRRMLSEAPPACDQVSFTLAGLSLAAWNVIGSLLILALALFALSSRRPLTAA